MRVTGSDNVWAIGDAAAVPDPAQSAARRRARPPLSTRSARAAWSATTWPPRWPGASRGRSATGRSACSWTWASTRRWPRCSGLRLRGFPAWFAARSYHLAMMPGMARRVRLAVDWTVGLLFGRASAELGQLGHPPSLEAYLDDATSAGRAHPAGERAGVPRGRAERPAGRVRAGRGGLGRVAAGPRAAPAGPGPTEEELRDGLAARASADRVPRRAGGGCFSSARTAASWSGYALHGALRRDGRADRAVGGSLAPGPRRGPRRCSSAAGPGRRRPSSGRLVRGGGTPADLSLFTEFGVMPVSGHWHMRHRVEQYLERRAQELDTTEPAVHVLTLGARRGGVEAPRAGRDRPRAPAAARVLRPHPQLPGAVDAERGRATALCWVSTRARSGRRWASSPEDLVPVVLAALDRVAKMQEPETFGVFCTTDSWWLLDRLRRLGFRVYWPAWMMSSVPAARARPLPARPAPRDCCERPA